MSLLTIGHTTIDTSLLGRRDAFHVPAVLVSSLEYVIPGQRVRFVDETCLQVSASLPHQAIVDPFMLGPVPPGTLFWVLLSPDCVSDVVHSFDIRLDDSVPPSPEVEEDAEDDDTDWDCRGCDS